MKAPLGHVGAKTLRCTTYVKYRAADAYVNITFRQYSPTTHRIPSSILRSYLWNLKRVRVVVTRIGIRYTYAIEFLNCLIAETKEKD